MKKYIYIKWSSLKMLSRFLNFGGCDIDGCKSHVGIVTAIQNPEQTESIQKL
jgi:hypothetical protein